MASVLESVTKIRITSNLLPPIELDHPFKEGAKTEGLSLVGLIAPRVEVFFGDSPIAVNIGGRDPMEGGWIIPTTIAGLGTLLILILAIRGMLK